LRWDDKEHKKMKQIWPNYSYSPSTNVLTLTGLNIDRDQLLLVTAADRGRIMYNFADSSVTASAFTSGANTALTLVATTAGLTTTAALVIYYDDQLQSTSVSISNLPSTQTIAGTVTANVFGYDPANDEQRKIRLDEEGCVNVVGFTGGNPIGISGTVTANLGSALPAGTNSIGVVTIGAGTVTLGASTSQIGSVTASISGWLSSVIAGAELNIGGSPIQATNPVPARMYIGTGSGAAVSSGNPMPISGTVTIGNSLTIASLPALVAGTAQIGSVTASISNSVTIASLPAISGTVTANTFALQGTAVTTSNFTSTTASTVLANYNATREVLTIFNEGAGNLHICAGATCTTIAYQVRLSAGDYYEVPNHQTTITHSAVFATAGTARIVQIS
jgi:hypothetical protein